MLRIHFTDRDLARVEVAAEPDPLWETVLAAQQLSSAARGGHAAFGQWRHRARGELEELRLGGALRAVLTLAPARAGYFPDFLTPGASAAGLTEGLDALRATPRGTLAEEMARTFRRRGAVHPWCRDLARGDRTTVAELADGIGRLHRAMVAPGWSAAQEVVESDRAIRARALRDGGVHGLLGSFAPYARWEPPTLSVAYPCHRDLHLAGRGLRLVPSRFCCRTPIALADPALPQVLVYPADGAPSAGQCAHRARALATLLGRTRARVLLALASGATTGELAVRLAVSAATASGHVSALREAGLVMSRRHGGSVVHTLAPLGAALLHGGEQARPRPAPHRPVSAPG